MRIGFDAKRVFHNFRGLGNYGRNLLEGLEKYHSEHEYHLFTPTISDPRGQEWMRKHPNFKIHEPKNLLGKSLSSLWRSNLMVKDIRREELDLYHGLSHELPNGIEKLGIKTLVTIHDLIYLKFPHYFPVIDRKVYDIKFRHACNVADKVVAICQQTKNDLLENFNIDENKIVVCYQSCHHRFYKNLENDKKVTVRNLYQLPEDYALFVGAFEQRKNVLGLLRALSMMKNKINLVLIGNGSNAYKKEMRETIEALKLENRVFIRSDVNSTDLPAIYQAAKMFVFPSFYEGFGIPIIEAQFSDTPVITSQGSCFPETAGAGAIFINPYHHEEIAHAMDKLCEDDLFARDLVHEGRKHVERFHRSNTTKVLMDLYQSL